MINQDLAITGSKIVDRQQISWIHNPAATSFTCTLKDDSGQTIERTDEPLAFYDPCPTIDKTGTYSLRVVATDGVSDGPALIVSFKATVASISDFNILSDGSIVRRSYQNSWGKVLLVMTMILIISSSTFEKRLPERDDKRTTNDLKTDVRAKEVRTDIPYREVSPPESPPVISGEAKAVDDQYEALLALLGKERLNTGTNR